MGALVKSVGLCEYFLSARSCVRTTGPERFDLHDLKCILYPLVIHILTFQLYVSVNCQPCQAGVLCLIMDFCEG